MVEYDAARVIVSVDKDVKVVRDLPQIDPEHQSGWSKKVKAEEIQKQLDAAES